MYRFNGRQEAANDRWGHPEKGDNRLNAWPDLQAFTPSASGLNGRIRYYVQILLQIYHKIFKSNDTFLLVFNTITLYFIMYF